MRIRWRGLELPTRVEPDRAALSDTYGKFIVEPFERGFGTTVGNSLRRILLSSLEGAAPVSVKIAGADHEFAQLDGVMEDVTDIILNVKSLIISMESDTPKILSVTKKGPGIVTGGGPRRRRRHHHPQQEPRARHPHRRHHLQHGTRNPQGPRLRHRRRKHPRRADHRRHPHRLPLLPRHTRPLQNRGHPRRPENQLRPPRHRNLDQRHRHPRNGPRRGRQNPPQTPQRLRPVFRARRIRRCRTHRHPRPRRPRHERGTPEQTQRPHRHPRISPSAPATASNPPRSTPSANWPK